MLRSVFVLALVGVLASYTVAQQPKKPTLPWKADRDMEQLQGQWKVARDSSGWLPKDAGEVNQTLVEALLAKDAVLSFNKNHLEFPTAKLSATASNATNKVDDVFKYGDFSNTTEPYLVITPKDGKPITISYIVQEKALQIRYPARSCSRSGTILSFIRVETDKGK